MSPWLTKGDATSLSGEAEKEATFYEVRGPIHPSVSCSPQLETKILPMSSVKGSKLCIMCHARLISRFSFIGVSMLSIIRYPRLWQKQECDIGANGQTEEEEECVSAKGNRRERQHRDLYVDCQSADPMSKGREGRRSSPLTITE